MEGDTTVLMENPTFLMYDMEMMSYGELVVVMIDSTNIAPCHGSHAYTPRLDSA